MGLFNQNQEQKPRNINNVIMIRILAAGYLLYLFWEVLQMYFKGGEEAPEIWMLLLAALVLVGGPVVIGILTYKEWKRSRELARQLADEEDDDEYEDEFDDEEYEDDAYEEESEEE